MSTIYIPIRVLLSERIRELIPKCMHAAAALFDRCMEPTADAHMMDKLKHLVTQAGEKFLIRPNASPIDRSSATSIRILQCDHAAIANAPGNLQRANGFLLFRLQRGILPPPPDHAPLQHSARTEAHTVTALLQNGDGVSPPIWFQSMIVQRNCSPSCSALQVGPNRSLFVEPFCHGCRRRLCQAHSVIQISRLEMESP